MPEAKNVLVTGGTGFIGSALIRQLLKTTEHLICNLDKLTYAANPAALTEVQHNKKYQFNKIDITNSEDVQNIIYEFQPDIIYHLAAETHVDRSIDSSDAFMLTNVLGTHNLLKASLAYWEGLSEKKLLNLGFIIFLLMKYMEILENMVEHLKKNPDIIPAHRIRPLRRAQTIWCAHGIGPMGCQF